MGTRCPPTPSRMARRSGCTTGWSYNPVPSGASAWYTDLSPRGMVGSANPAGRGIRAMGPSRVAAFRVLFPNKHDGFEELFFDCLDSWFSADIACCDACYDAFVARWPGTYLRDLDFQRSGTPLECFYEGSDLADVFTKDEFLADLPRVRCPRCDEPLTANIWPYNLPFELPPDFEKQAKEIALIVRDTPFLALMHPFARQMLEEICRIAKTAPKAVPSSTYYRGRCANEVKGPGDPTEFGPPPPPRTTEGRYNHAGRPVLYLSSDPNTCLLELGEPPDGAYVAPVALLGSPQLLDLSDEAIESDVLKALIASSLLSAPSPDEGWDRPCYVFSRFVADCVRSARVQALRYPSTRATLGHNLVIFPSPAGWEGVFSIGAAQFHRPAARPRRLDG